MSGEPSPSINFLRISYTKLYQSIENSGNLFIMLRDEEKLDSPNPPSIITAEDKELVTDTNDGKIIPKQILLDSAIDGSPLSTEMGTECAISGNQEGSNEENDNLVENDSYLNGWRLNTLLLG